MIVTSVAPYAASVVAGATKSDAVCAFHHRQRVNRAKFAKKSQPPKYSASFFTMRREKEHLLSTSNHNSSLFIGRPPQVELYLLSTSNHTPVLSPCLSSPLSYIFFLHQTTTGYCRVVGGRLLSYIFFLHQTTTGKFHVQIKD